jgi:hypothetical protein
MSRPKLLHRKPTRSVTLKESTIRMLNALGEGNLSAGIEIAFQGYLGFRALQGMGPIEPLEHVAPNEKIMNKNKKAAKKKTVKKK